MGSMHSSGKCYVLEGNIGVGKTTLTKKGEKHGLQVMEEEINSQFLQLFYSDPKRYGFAFQYSMLMNRNYQNKLNQHMGTQSLHRIWDRSMLGDYVFSLTNFLLGNIDSKEMDAYEHQFGATALTIQLHPFLNQVDHIIYLDDSPCNCKIRVEELRGNSEEKDIPLSYYEALDDVYFYVMCCILNSEHRDKVLVKKWGQYDSWNQAITYVTNGNTNSRKEYIDDSSVLEDFQKYWCDGKIKPREGVVTFSKSIMNRDTVKDCGGDEKRSIYQKLIATKQNEYKRLVMFYLSCGAEVVFT